MAKCSICEKEVPQGATECSLTCNQEASSRFKAGTAADARSAFGSAMRKMLQPKPRELQEQLEVPMIVVKHRWKKNRNDVAGSVVLGFNDEGIAKVPNMGNNRTAVETYCRFSKGLAKIVDPEVVEKPVAPKKKAPEEFKKVTTNIPTTEKTPLVSAKEVVDSKGGFRPIEKTRPASTKEVMTSAMTEEKPAAEKISKKKTFKKKTVGKKSRG